ncbi:hypothetical protein F2Q68_00044767 [Brassica cretica]|uniref:Uncharacterized protein n=1 Tax=Brassica cretica TaxID=69181 RepID=A0A8S9LV22_BRACR|nr:hypothetical protein F2Q68_00044767 [Brassica cretica]
MTLSISEVELVGWWICGCITLSSVVVRASVRFRMPISPSRCIITSCGIDCWEFPNLLFHVEIVRHFRAGSHRLFGDVEIGVLIYACWLAWIWVSCSKRYRVC